MSGVASKVILITGASSGMGEATARVTESELASSITHEGARAAMRDYRSCAALKGCC